jgi:4-amino-4-deoxy-L-arabinose transferase-like glycosyltransferase
MREVNRATGIWALALFSGLLIPWLVQRGMFLDGVTYAAISNNLAMGQGSFWKPHYTPTLYPVFYEHPPLVFGLQSGLFTIFGDQFWVERLYSFLSAIGVIAGMLFCTNQVLDRDKAIFATALSVILWISIPLVFWSFRNNMLENTSSVFTLFSVGAFLAYRKKGKAWYAIPGALFLIAAFLSKGPAATFPLIAPFLALMLFREEKGSYYFYVSYGCFFMLAIILYFLSDELQTNLKGYFLSQVFPALEGKREVTTDNRFKIVGKFVMEGALSVLLLIVIWIKQKKIALSSASLFFLLISLSASLPLIISLKQRSYYLVPAFPFLAMATAVAISPLLSLFLRNRSSIFLKRFRLVGVASILLVLVYSATLYGSYSRNKGLIEDAVKLSELFPRGQVFSVSKADWEDWGFHAILSRKGSFGLDMNREHECYLTKSPDYLPVGYKRIDEDLKELYLLRKTQ